MPISDWRLLIVLQCWRVARVTFDFRRLAGFPFANGTSIGNSIHFPGTRHLAAPPPNHTPMPPADRPAGSACGR
jgi:hypothetical protein